MKLTRKQLKRIILETTDPKFIENLKGLWSQWQDVQSAIPTKTEIEPHYGYYWDEDLPLEERLEKSASPAAWPQLGAQAIRLNQ